MLQSVELLGVPIHSLTLEGAAEHIVHAAKAGAGGWVVTPNLDILRRAFNDPGFRRMYDATTLRLADGMPLVWASRLKRTPLPERAAGSDLIFELADHAAKAGVSMYLIGGNPGTADKTSARLRELYPSLKIAGIECPEVGFERDEAHVQSMVARVGATEAGIVLVALGCPKQEALIERMRPQLPRTWFVGVGITFSFVAGEVHRAPVWMRRTGIEWMHRLVQEPRRLARRYLIDGLPFAVRLLATSALQGLARPAGQVESRRAR
ncbi:MAG: WecB/TagA/CpsF family glycosyltransferase [Planctomycetes bacterium]|nr:WecB/TagA/CpsF family glycosyltransferase [Planctomycetota bacterium]